MKSRETAMFTRKPSDDQPFANEEAKVAHEVKEEESKVGGAAKTTETFQKKLGDLLKSDSKEIDEQLIGVEGSIR